MLRVNQLFGFGARSEAFSIQLGETRTTSDGTDGAAVLFNDVYLGPPWRNRYVALAYTQRADGSPSSVQVNGVTLQLEIGSTRTVTTPDIRSAIYTGVVSSGISVQVRINWPVFAIDSGAFTIFRIASPFDVDFDAASGQALTNINTTINIAEGGALLVAVSQNQGDTATLGGVTKIIQAGVDSSNGGHNHVIGFSSDLSAQTGRAISVSGGSTERTLVGLSISPGS